MHQRHQAFGAENEGASSSCTTATTIATIAHNNQVSYAQRPQPSKRRKRRRSTKRGEDTTLILVLIGLVCLAIIIGIAVVLWLLRPTSTTARLHDGSTRSGTFATADTLGQHHRRPPSGEEEFEELPPSKIYTIPHSMHHIGDRSDEYARLRKMTDAKLPYDPKRSLEAVEEVVNYHPSTFAEDIPYDIYNCPEEPPPGYPFEWKTLELLEHWSPEDTSIPDKIHQGLCVFDYRKDYVKALTYRSAEAPFVVRNDPDVAAVVERWASPGFLDKLMGNVRHRAEVSESNHFMYWVPGNAKRQRNGNPPPAHEPPGWTAPTKMIRMTYNDFVQKANQPKTNQDPHWYFRLIGCGETGPTGDCDAGSSEWLFDELTFFQPRSGLLYLKDPSKQRGIHCRVGMEGVTIANHFDQSRNAIALLGGKRRYILSHPKHCSNLALYPKGHPSTRHSAVDWSHPDLDEYPEFAEAMSNEILLQAGDVLYLPTNYFHYIVSLGLNFQCNTRSGTDESAMPTIRDCGF